MDFSDDWKSLWSSSFVFRAPSLLLPNLSFLGPLVFHPHPSVQNLEPTILLHLQNLFSTPLPPTPASFLHANFIPLSLLYSLASDASSLDQPTPFQQNFLHVLHRSNGDLILFLTRGENLDCISYVVLTTQNQIFCIAEYNSDKIFTVCPKLGYQIFKIVVSSEENSTTASGNCVIEGYLVACTLYTVHWYRIESRVSCDHLEAPALVHLGFSELKTRVIHVCWNPHLQEESMVLLETGELRLFDLNHCSRFLRHPAKLHGSRVMVPLDDENIFGLEKEHMSWLGCEFSWHPRVLIVARSDVVFLLDFRCKDSSLTILAKIELCDSVRHCLGKEDCFVSFSGAKFDKFFFSVATKYHLLLFDIRQPLSPILRWDHGLDDPTIAQMFKLSELRPSSSNCKFNWASESGFAILLGSLWNSEFNVYCYGPFLSSDGSVASKFNKLEHGVYAWGLPSKLSLLGYPCECGDCLVKEYFSKSKHSVGNSLKKKEKVLGFVILSDYLLDKTYELNGLGGFTLIRLTSSGRLESQKYKASCDVIVMKSKCREPSLSCCTDSTLLPLNNLHEFSFKFKYVRLNHLLSYSKGNLVDVYISKMHPEGSSIKNMSNFWELPLLDALKTTQVSQSGSSLDFSDVLHEITYPTSLYEIACKKIWTGLPLDVVQLAFVRRSDLYGEEKKHIGKDNYSSDLKEEVDKVCEEVANAVDNMVNHLRGRSSLFQEDSSSQVMQEGQAFFIREPLMNLDADAVKEKIGLQVEEALFKEKKFGTLISRKQERNFSSDGQRECVGLEMFDDLCPIGLSFDSPNRSVSPMKLKMFKCLQKQYSKWQDGFKPYKDFCTSANLI
ncbi:hypothetical protein H6P81_020818 [Aristolochia fimbriata]|uniref:Uncharacterized protein n=1 Tax=Aristolochia fimbriata TaxID=158543 RepID=A0AAV7DWG8_ARIFI|nr:hypothetical protein H6P81_020818 [Aristolochia fimbriata]